MFLRLRIFYGLWHRLDYRFLPRWDMLFPC